VIHVTNARERKQWQASDSVNVEMLFRPGARRNDHVPHDSSQKCVTVVRVPFYVNARRTPNASCSKSLCSNEMCVLVPVVCPYLDIDLGWAEDASRTPSRGASR